MPVSIHAPRVGRDQPPAFLAQLAGEFQFTRPAWGATLTRRGGGCRVKGFNSRAPRGARHLGAATSDGRGLFQFTRPAWGATMRYEIVAQEQEFQFTRPAWGATAMSAAALAAALVSIHAPRVGRDGLDLGVADLGGVSIHAPRVGRDERLHRRHDRHLRFQFTRPAWGATRPSRDAQAPSRCFNSRAPRGARPGRGRACSGAWRFNSRAPRGARHEGEAAGGEAEVSIHAPRVGRDRAGRFFDPERVFQFTRPAWGATRAAFVTPR